MDKNKIKNLVFDFGGILVGLDKHRCIAALDSIGAFEISVYVDECRQEDLFHDLEIGRISVAEFCDEVRRKSPRCTATDEKIAWAWGELLTGIPQEKLQMLRTLKEKYRLLLLSNTNVIHWEKAVNEYFILDDMRVGDFFDRAFLSYEMGMVKPDDEIFTTMLAEVGLKAEETLFIDDSKANCDAAERLGINVLHDRFGDRWSSMLSVEG